MLHHSRPTPLHNTTTSFKTYSPTQHIMALATSRTTPLPSPSTPLPSASTLASEYATRGCRTAPYIHTHTHIHTYMHTHMTTDSLVVASLINSSPYAHLPCKYKSDRPTSSSRPLTPHPPSRRPPSCLQVLLLQRIDQLPLPPPTLKALLRLAADASSSSGEDGGKPLSDVRIDIYRGAKGSLHYLNNLEKVRDELAGLAGEACIDVDDHRPRLPVCHSTGRVIIIACHATCSAIALLPACPDRPLLLLLLLLPYRTRCTSGGPSRCSSCSSRPGSCTPWPATSTRSHSSSTPLTTCHHGPWAYSR